MPSTHEQVTIPDHLRGDYVPEEEQQPNTIRAEAVQAVVALVIVLLSAVGIGVGVGAWVHWGAGLAAGCLALWVTGILMGYTN